MSDDRRPHPSRLLDLAERHGISADPKSLAEFARGLIAEVTLTLQGAHDLEASRTMSFDLQDEAPRDVPRQAAAPRYLDTGQLGKGGHGEVRQVYDRYLERTLAMKLLAREHLPRPATRAAFLQEARLTSQLQHPGVIAVHDLGETLDGRPFITMPEVRGQTLSQVLLAVHASSRDGVWGETADGWGLNRLIEALHKACEAVASAHAAGVVHRDLKPSNIMVGAFGQVLVLDWGLAVRLSDGVPPGIVGTPAYMSWEQAKGGPVGPRADVFSLGATLYAVLSGRPPFSGHSLEELQRRVASLEPPPPLGPVADHLGRIVRKGDGPVVPEALDVICRMALAPDPVDRYRDAGELADALASWLRGTARRTRARAHVDAAEAIWPACQRLRTQARQLRLEAAARLRVIPTWAPEDDKVEAWALQDRASALERRAALEEVRAEMLLDAALVADAQLPDAHAAMARLHQARHQAAELRRDRDAAALAEARLRPHLEALPIGHPDRPTHLDQRSGRVILHCEVPVAVALLRVHTHHRRLVTVEEGRVPPAARHALTLDAGSWVLRLEAEGRESVLVPVLASSHATWEAVAPGAAEPAVVRLPVAGSLGESCFVPGGWFSAGGDRDADDSLPGPQRVWVDDFVMGRFPVTNTEYIAFLDDLVDRGREQDALRWAPRAPASKLGEQGALAYHRDGRGHFHPLVDAQGDAWLPRNPVVAVDWPSAAAYAAWLAERTGQPWRLPTELEWEKAARGVDGRWFPWGDHHDPSWSCMRDSHPERRTVPPVDTFPIDCSPYGVRGLGGAVRDWCADVYHRDGAIDDDGRAGRGESADPGARRVQRGGAWYGFAKDARAANRFSAEPGARFYNIGFRVCRA